MPYCTETEFIDSYPRDQIIRVSDDDAVDDLSSEQISNITTALTDAAAVIDSKIGTRFALPLVDETGSPANSAVLKDLNKRIGIYKLHVRVFNNPKIPEKIKDDFDLAMETLDEIVSGKAYIDLPEDVLTAQSGSGFSAITEDAHFDYEGY